MKISRLLTYAVTGVISGLLVENAALMLKQKVKDKGRRLEKEAGKALRSKQ